MVPISPGHFAMGDLHGDGDLDERPVHAVVIGRAFALGRYEITFDEYERYCDEKGDPVPDDGGFGRGRRPVVNITWHDATAYAAWLSRQTAHRYRLPSEAEWEYAARGGTGTRFWWGEQAGAGHANCAGCETRWESESTAPVGRFPASPFGVQDMSGNVWEWVADCYHDSYEGVPADGRPYAPPSCGQRVVRGGSWILPPREMRAANRWRWFPVLTADELGFRVARDLQ
jgi:formylglycine-generating enzyme required for sulfatase activity